MVRWHMVGQGGIAVFFPAPCMYGEPFVLMVDLDDVVGIDQLDLFAYMSVGYAVIMLVLPKIDMAVLVHGGLGISFYLIAFRR